MTMKAQLTVIDDSRNSAAKTQSEPNFKSLSAMHRLLSVQEIGAIYKATAAQSYASGDSQ
ncbi:hypothetical protein [Pseudochrobactrum sp. B5]|uniref:hypothetical protein n=1 Tax=Pseudochrobactrum sp. B5 TaxID=1289478 RepID=UPI0009519AAF|nr:hypothetical protein [Pseudochrobactrum sp. B5]